ncbi:MAG: response regulator transcription factor [Opitutales bacterium]
MNTLEIHTEQAPNTLQDEKPLILIVEDNVDLLSAIVDEFEDDYRVESAANGSEGLKKANSLLPDLIISDVMMPVLDGLSFCREIKNTDHTSQIPVILLTVKSKVENQIEGLDLGADDYIPKPFVPEILQARVRNLIASRRRMQEQQEIKSKLSHESAPTDDSFVKKLVECITANYSDSRFDADKLASLFNLSIRGLQRKMKAKANTSPALMIRDIRMTRAAELLIHTEKSMTEIAFEVGIEDSSHFARTFRDKMDMSPSAYRQKFRK